MVTEEEGETETDTAGEVVTAATENDVAARADDNESLDTVGIDTVTCDTVMGEAEPDISILDLPDDESNPCWISRIE